MPQLCLCAPCPYLSSPFRSPPFVDFPAAASSPSASSAASSSASSSNHTVKNEALSFAPHFSLRGCFPLSAFQGRKRFWVWLRWAWVAVRGVGEDCGRGGWHGKRLSVLLSVVGYTVHSTQFTVHSSQYTVHSTQYTVRSTQYTVHSTQYTVRSTT